MRGCGIKLVALLTACCIEWTAHAQSPAKIYQLGILTTGADFESFDPVTLPELARLGFVEGRNLIVQSRFAQGAAERLPGFARELVAARVDVIIAVSNVSIEAAKEATSTIPIVMSFAGDDPIADGLVASFAHPGANITGLAMFATEGDEKRLELLTEAIPEARRIGFLANRAVDPNRITRVEKVASRIGAQLILAKVTDRDDYAQAFASFASSNSQGLAVQSHPLFPHDVGEISALALKARLPTVCEWKEMAKAVNQVVRYDLTWALCPLRCSSLQPRIVTAGGDIQNVAHGGDRVSGLVLAHEPEPFGGTVFVSRANQAAAFDRISRSSRSWRFSRRSRLSSSRSAVLPHHSISIRRTINEVPTGRSAISSSL